MSLAEWFNWQWLKQKSKTSKPVPPTDPYAYQVREARLSDTARMRMRKLFGRGL